MKTFKRPFIFFVEIALWFLFVAPLSLAVPLFFLAPFIFLMGSIPALMAGIFLGFQYRSRSIPKYASIRATLGAITGALSTMLFYFVILLFDGFANFDLEYLRIASFGFSLLAILGGVACAVTFALIPEEIRNRGIK